MPFLSVSLAKPALKCKFVCGSHRKELLGPPGPWQSRLLKGMAACTTAPTHRLFRKTSVKAASCCVEGRRTQAAKARAAAVKAGLAPPARRAFPLFVQKNNTVQKGGSKRAFQKELKRLGKVWSRLPAASKQPYYEKSVEEFARQRDALAAHGIFCGQHPQKPAPVMEAPVSKAACIGPYVLEAQESGGAGPVRLGTGAYGKVYKSKCLETGRQLAVKAFYGRFAGDEAAQEIKLYRHLTANLLHSELHFFPVLHASDAASEPYPWLAMEYAGPSLNGILRAGPKLPRQSIFAIAAQLKFALIALHQAGILHLDVKPANILWCGQLQQLKLCDMGMAEMRDVGVKDLRYTEYVTYPFRPPELLDVDGEKEPQRLHRLLTPAVDQWSFGCTIFSVATSKLLMEGLVGKADGWSKATLSLWCANWSHFANPKQARRANLSSQVQQLYSRLQLAADLQGSILKACNPKALNRCWPAIADLKAGVEGQPACVKASSP